jgi:hypothetical protein
VVDLPDVEPFVAISLYGRMAPLCAQTSVPRAVADLTPLFDAPPFNRPYAAIVKRQSETRGAAQPAVAYAWSTTLAAGGGRSDEFVKEGVGDAQ